MTPTGGDPGEVAFVLHTHLPWVKNHGVWPVGEEWLFQAWGESWYPVTRMLLRLAEDGFRNVLTLGVTPLVAWQVADQRLRDDLGTWLAGQMWRSEEQRSLGWFLGPDLADLGTFYWRHYAGLVDFHAEVERAGGLLAVWADLESRGVIELLGGPATHPYLPLQTDPALIDAQLRCGLDHHASWAGARPSGIWAPEMGYRPAGRVADATAKPTRVDRHGTPRLPRRGAELAGLEDHYTRAGVTHFLVDAPTLVTAAGGRDRDWTVRPQVPDPTAADPYEVVHDGVLVGDSDVVAFARDLSVAYHVWSPTAGYPGDVWYRDFHAYGFGFGMHKSFRVTDKQLGAHDKAPYDPDGAARSVARDAAHLHGVLREVLDPRPGALVVAAYDTELFGHWWFEGPAWLETLLRRVAADPQLRATTLAGRLERRPPTRRLHLPESSWGYAKGHASWVTTATRPMWQDLQRSQDRLQPWLAADLTPPAARVRDQAIRELAQLACSDWPFMVTRGNSPDYAFERFHHHREAFDELVGALAAGTVPERLGEIETRDQAPTDIAAFLSAGTARSR